jgi:hypothetical protein
MVGGCVGVGWEKAKPVGGWKEVYKFGGQDFVRSMPKRSFLAIVPKIVLVLELVLAFLEAGQIKASRVPNWTEKTTLTVRGVKKLDK